MTSTYHETRLAEDKRRDVVWKSLWDYHFRKHVSANACVLDLGCGYGDFINNVKARRRIGLDNWPGITEHLGPGVEAIVSNVTELDGLDDGSIDLAFASNLFEHISKADFARVLDSLRAKLSERGRLIILQPNYRYAFREYFDDYTHISVFSHVSLADFLTAHGYDVVDLRSRFLPLTVKSRLPVWPALIGLYLKLPIKPFGKQMLVEARPRRKG